MTRTIFCQKLQKEAAALDRPPYPGATGIRIFENISKEAWDAWLNHQTILINEYRLNMLDADARKFLSEEMEKFLFEGGSAVPDAFVPPESE